MAHICLSQSHPTVDPHPSNDETPRANIPQGNFMLEYSGDVRQPSLFSLNLLPYGDAFAFRSRPIHHQMTTVLSDCGQLFESRGSSRRPSPPQGLIIQPRGQPAGAFMRGRRTREPAINHIASWLHVHKPTARASGTCLGGEEHPTVRLRTGMAGCEACPLSDMHAVASNFTHGEQRAGSDGNNKEAAMQ